MANAVHGRSLAWHRQDCFLMTSFMVFPPLFLSLLFLPELTQCISSLRTMDHLIKFNQLSGSLGYWWLQTICRLETVVQSYNPRIQEPKHRDHEFKVSLTPERPYVNWKKNEAPRNGWGEGFIVEQPEASGRLHTGQDQQTGPWEEEVSKREGRREGTRKKLWWFDHNFPP